MSAPTAAAARARRRDAEGPLVVACVRPVDPHPRVDALTGRVGPDARCAELPPGEAAAVEHALRAAEAWSGRILVVSAGPAEVEPVLRDISALGIAVLRVHDADQDPAPAAGAGERAAAAGIAQDEQALAAVLAAAITHSAGEPPALVLCGAGSPHRGTGALPALLAHELGAAQALGLVRLEARAPAGAAAALVGERRLDGGRRELLHIPLPAVCSVEAGGVRLRRASLAGALAAARAPVRWTAPAPLRRPGLRVRGVRAYRPRTRHVAPPPGDTAHERLLALTNAAQDRDPPTVLGPLEAEQAAEELLAFLRRHGYR
ncbi:hypothetical protein GCM10009799_45650 [Nocardiopsis rhodophaea]|uniref:Electron transfer flavoprotein small subunit n=1 Tax=Nocardiopsis rhodophaea TaxID=280238 RepID=A0ABN2TM25_9ACTN